MHRPRSPLGLFAVLVLCAGLLAWPVVGCGGEKDPSEGETPRAGYAGDGRYFGPARPKPTTQPPNLIVLMIDTLRHDAVSAPGEPGGLMPFTSGLAEHGVTMHDAVAPAPWTVPSVTSFLTGLLPSVHGSDQPLQAPRLVPAVATYAEILRESHGYETWAYTAGPWLAGKNSILQGFTYGSRGFALRGSGTILKSFATKRDKDRPFFLFLHSYEAHDPYGPSGHPWPHRPRTPGRQSSVDLDAITEPWQYAHQFFLNPKVRMDLYERHGAKEVARKIVRYVHGGYQASPRPQLAADMRAGYEDGLRWVDGLVKSTFERLKAAGALENTVVVVTSDHGEAFGEHGILAHGRQLYDELIRIPMVLTGPEPFDGGRTVPGAVGLLDVLPTFLDHIGGAPLPGVQGRSFLPLLRGEGAGRSVFAEEILNQDNTMEDTKVVLTSVRSGRWKYIITFDRLKGTVMEEAYDLAQDPGERSDLCGGTGRIDGLRFDAAFCRAVETARDRIWGAVGQSERLVDTPYGGGSAQVTSERPKACGS